MQPICGRRLDRSRHPTHIECGARQGSSRWIVRWRRAGLISGELFKSDSAFQKKVSDQLALPTMAKPEDHTIVFGIISKSRGDELELPFFSRLNLKHAVRRLKNFGYTVKIAKIKVARASATPKTNAPEMAEADPL